MPHYPDIQILRKLKTEGDEMFRVQRSIRASLSALAKIIFSAVLVLFLNIFFEGYLRFSRFSPALPDFSLRWLALIPTFYILHFLRGYFDVIYIFGHTGVTQHKGRLSLNKEVPYVKYIDILALRVHQDPWGRLFNYGDIDLDTSASAGVEMRVEGVAFPEELGELLEELRRGSFRDLHSPEPGNISK